MSEVYGPQRQSDISADVDLREVEEALRRIELAGYDIRPVFMKARRAMRADMRAHKQAQAGPDGSWVPLSPLTVAKKKARTGKQGRPRRRPAKPPRRMLGRLPGAFNIVIGPHSMKAISRVAWSGVHQEGGRAGKRARVPSREFLWISSGLVNAVAASASDFMLRAWEGRNG